jgi:hypothetical protein
MNVLFDNTCGKFNISLIEKFNGGKSISLELNYQYGAVVLKTLTFNPEQKQTAIDIAAHIFDAVESYRNTVVENMARSISRI